MATGKPVGFIPDDQAEKFFTSPGFVPDEKAEAFFTPKGETGATGVATGATKQVGRSVLGLADMVPAVAILKRLSPEFGAKFDAAIAKAQEKLQPQGRTEGAAATATDVARGVGMMAAGGAALPGIGAGTGVLGGAARAVVANPKTAGAVIGAVPGAVHGDLKATVAGAAAGAGIPLGLGGLAKVAGSTLARKLAGATVAKSTPAIVQAEEQLAKALTSLGHPAERAAEMARAEIAKVATPAVEATVSRATTPATFANPNDQLLIKFKHLIESSGANKANIKEMVKETFPQSWEEVWKMLNAPRTRI